MQWPHINSNLAGPKHTSGFIVFFNFGRAGVSEPKRFPFQLYSISRCLIKLQKTIPSPTSQEWWKINKTTFREPGFLIIESIIVTSSKLLALSSAEKFTLRREKNLETFSLYLRFLLLNSTHPVNPYGMTLEIWSKK